MKDNISEKLPIKSSSKKKIKDSYGKAENKQLDRREFKNNTAGAFLARKIGRTVSIYSKGKWVSIICFLIYFLQLFSTLFSQKFAENFSQDHNYSIINNLYLSLSYSKIYPAIFLKFSNLKQRELTIICIGILNLLIYSHGAWQILSWFQSLKNQVQNLKERNEKQQKNYFLNFFNHIISVIFQIYPYVIWIPSIEVSFTFLFNDSSNQSYQKVICVFNLISALAITYQSKLFDKNYSFFKTKNFLAQRINNFKYISLLSDMFIQIIAQYNNAQLSSVFHLISSVIRSLIIIRETPFFLSNKAQIYTLFQNIFYSLSSLSSSIVVSYNSSFQSQSKVMLFSLFLLIFFTLSFKLSIIIVKKKKPDYGLANSPQFEKEAATTFQFVRYLYSLMDLSDIAYEDYMRDGKGVDFENIYAGHVMKHFQGQSLKECFCEKYSKEYKNLSISELNGTSYRKNFLIEYASQAFQTFFRCAKKGEKEKMEIYTCYIYFLIEIAKAPAKAYSQILELKESLKLGGFRSLWQQCQLYEQEDHINNQFQKFFQSSTYQNQRLNLPLILEYDNLCFELKQGMKQGLSMREQFFNFLYNDNIRLQNLISIGNKCLESKNQIQKKMLLLFDVNPDHQQTLLLAELFVEFFEFRKRRLSSFYNNSKLFLRKLLLKVDFKINLFTQNSCSLFVSLSDSHLSIIQASDSSSEFFNFENSEAFINKSFVALTPDWVSPSFMQMVRFLEQEGNMKLIKLGQYFTFLKNSQLKIFPVLIRASLGVLIEDGFGLALHIQKISNSTTYLICNSNFQLIASTPQTPYFLKTVVSEKNQIFKSYSNHLKVKKEINLLSLIPLLFALNSETILDMNSTQGFDELIGFRDINLNRPKILTSLLMRLKSDKESDPNLKREMINNSYEIQKYFEGINYFNYSYEMIQFTIYKIAGLMDNTQNIYAIEVIKTQQIKKVQEINELLHQLQTELQYRFPLAGIRIPLVTFLDKNHNNSSSQDRAMNIGVTEYLSFNEFQAEQDQLLNRENSYKSPLDAIAIDDEYQNKIEEDDTRINSSKNNPDIIDEFASANQLDSPKKSHQLKITNMNLLSSTNLISPANNSLQEISLRSQKQDDINIIKIDQKHQFRKDKFPSMRFSDTITKSQIYRLQTTGQTTERHNLINESKQDFTFLEDNLQKNNQRTTSIKKRKKKRDNDSTPSSYEGEIIKKLGGSSSSNSYSKQNKKGFIDDQSSINSTQSQFFSKKQSLFDMIATRKQTKEIIIGKLVGLTSLFIIIFVTIFLYVSLRNQIDQEKIYYGNLLMGPYLLESFSQIMRCTELKTTAYVGSTYKFLPHNFSAKDLSKFKIEVSTKISNITKDLGVFQNKIIEDGLVDSMLGDKTEIDIVNVVNYSDQMVTYTRLYSLLNLPIYLKGYSDSGAKEWRQYVYQNQASFLETFNIIQEIQEDGANQKMNDSKVLILWSFAIYEIACFFSVVIILPLYYIIQAKREEILKLMVTFHPSFLQVMIQKHQQANQMEILSAKNIINQHLNGPKIQIRSKYDYLEVKKAQETQQKKHNAQKKRQVSTVNSLQRSSPQVQLLALIVFILISLYTLLNFIFTKDYFDNFLFNIEELSLISRTKSYISVDYLAVYLMMNSKPYSFSPKDYQTIKDLVKNLFESDLQGRIQRFQQIQQNFYSNDRGFISNYKKVVYEALLGNACNILNSTYQSTLPGLTTFSQSDLNIPTTTCENSWDGALTKGLTFYLQAFKNKLDSLFYLYVQYTDATPIATFGALGKWDYQNNLSEMDKIYYHVRNIIDTLTNFMRNQSINYLDQLKMTEFYLFLYSIIISTIVLLFIWNRYITWMSLSLFKTNMLLSLIPIEYSIDNPYILSYLYKEKSKSRRN